MKFMFFTKNKLEKNLKKVSAFLHGDAVYDLHTKFQVKNNFVEPLF